jgi:hypothetical protein
MENPPKKFFRLAPGTEVRLRWAYIVRCVSVVKDASGAVTEVRCTYDPATRGGDIPLGPDGKPHPQGAGNDPLGLSAEHAASAEVRLFDRLFKAEEPGQATGNWIDDLNPNSLEVVDEQIHTWTREQKDRWWLENVYRGDMPQLTLRAAPPASSSAACSRRPISTSAPRPGGPWASGSPR